MHDPSLDAYTSHRVEECLHKRREVVQALVFADLLVCEAAIVVGVEAGRYDFESVAAGRSNSVLVRRT